MKKTTSDFIKEAKAIHGNKYNYSQVNYKNQITAVIIICKKHGEFLQKPIHHTRGSGCTKCYRERNKYSFKTFVSKAKEVHGEKYKYPDQKIVKGISKTKVLIRCLKHGEFKQLGTEHLSGKGCYQCGLETISEKGRLKPKMFLERARKTHGERYDYSLTNFQGVDKKVKIICKEHGVFEQAPYNHMNGQNCPRCGEIQAGISGRMTFRDFIIKAKKVHHNRYSYDKESYIMASEKLKIKCPDHGIFLINGDSHLSGKGCYYCGLEKIRLDKLIPLNEIKELTQAKYESRYSYDFSNYKDSSTPISIECPDHGFFMSTIKQHLRSPHGCPLCSIESVAQFHTNSFSDYKERFIEKHGEKYKYNVKSFKSGGKKMEIICPKHGVFEQAPAIHKYGHGCPKCKSTKGENAIRIFLEIADIDFEEQKTFEGLKDKNPLFADFYLHKINTVLEYNGSQHYEAVDFFGGEKALERTQKSDKLKKQYCKENGINFEVIRYDEDVETRMNEILEKYSL